MFKKLILITALGALVAFALPSFAGEAKGKGKGLEHAPGQHKDGKHDAHGGHDSEARFKKLCEDLKLSDDQVKKAKPIWADTDKKMKALHDDRSLTEAQKKEKVRAAHEDGMAKFRAALTPEQQKKLDAINAEHHAADKGRGAHGKGGERKK